MDARENNFDKFLAENNTNFAIPVYQRNYDWTTIQCRQLFDDILKAGTADGPSPHFIGSIVYVHDAVYSAATLTELTIIDGQQRLTTLTLIYIAIFRLAKEMGDEKLASKIYATYLVNQHSEEEDKSKLKPTDNNKAALAQILDPDETVKVNGFSRLLENFRFFQHNINKFNYSEVRKGLDKLRYIDISLDRDKDDAQHIFESLNSTGLELSQADLIRNYILIGLSREKQEDLYKKYWEPIEANARNDEINQSRVSEFIRDYLTLKAKEIPNKSAVYETFKQKFPAPHSDKLREALSEIRSLSGVYTKLINPSKEHDLQIRREIIYINSLEINVAYPFLMQVYSDFEKGRISKDILIKVFQITHGFVWRRFIVALPTNSLNKIFMTLYDRVEVDDYIASIERSLMQRMGSLRFPRDAEVVASLKEKDMYNIKPRTRMYFFARIENFNNKEPVNIFEDPNITTEHIFPQNPDKKWKLELSDDEINQMEDKYLNTIGNLTLSGNNGKLSNKSFLEKRDMNVGDMEQGYSFSRLWLNRGLMKLNRWGVKEVLDRAETIGKRFLEVWPEPVVKIELNQEAEEINIFDTDEPSDRKLAYAKFFGQKISADQVIKLYIEVFKQLFDRHPDSFQGSELGGRIGLTDVQSELHQPLQISDNYFIEGEINNIEKFDRIKAALTALNIEDELYIKFA